MTVAIGENDTSRIPNKRTEYAARGIAEYWIVDPILQRATVLEGVEDL